MKSFCNRDPSAVPRVLVRRSSWRGTRQRGVTMIEVLISMVILLVGLLGLAGLQVSSMRNGTDDAQRAIAVRASSDLAERIRANYLVVDTVGGYVATAGATAMTSWSAGSPTCYGVASTCAAATRVVTDLDEWRAVLAKLPSAIGSTVCHDASPATNLTLTCIGGTTAPLVIKVFWQARNQYGAVSATTQAAPVWVLVQP